MITKYYYKRVSEIEEKISFKKEVARIIFIIILLTTLYIIFNFSAQDGEKSSGVSLKVTEFIVSIVSKVRDLDYDSCVKSLHPVVRKLAHFSIYAVVGFSLMGLFNTYNIQNKYKVIWTIIIGFLYALSDEFHQRFIPGRGPSIRDVGIDTLGVIFGMFVIMCFIKIINKRKVNKDISKKI